jgi:hypothetical protein
MQEGVAIALGSPIDIDFGGRTLFIDPLMMEDFATIETSLVAKRPSLVGQAIESLAELPAGMRGAAWLETIKQAKTTATIPLDEIIVWITSQLDGIAYSLWLQLEKRDRGEFRLPEVQRTLEHLLHSDPVAFQQLLRRRNMASGLDETKKLFWPDFGLADAGHSAEDAASGSGSSRHDQPPRSQTTWRHIFCCLAMPSDEGGRGMAPSEIRQLTLPEVSLYLCRELKDLGGSTMKVSLADLSVLRVQIANRGHRAATYVEQMIAIRNAPPVTVTS